VASPIKWSSKLNTTGKLRPPKCMKNRDPAIRQKLTTIPRLRTFSAVEIGIRIDLDVDLGVCATNASRSNRNFFLKICNQAPMLHLADNVELETTSQRAKSVDDGMMDIDLNVPSNSLVAPNRATSLNPRVVDPIQQKHKSLPVQSSSQKIQQVSFLHIYYISKFFFWGGGLVCLERAVIDK
jgi:hypothetical protein